MSEVILRHVPLAQKTLFAQHFQDYLAELSLMSGNRPNSAGVFEYGLFDLYWRDPHFMPFFIEWNGQRAGLLMLRELRNILVFGDEESLQLAEICVFRPFRRRSIASAALRLAAQEAEQLGLPLTWSAYMNNDPANAVYSATLDEFRAKEGWTVEQSRGIDQSGLARHYYRMTPPRAAAGARRPTANE